VPADVLILANPDAIVQRCNDQLLEPPIVGGPELFEIHLRRGFALTVMKKYEDAIKDFDEVLRLRPGNEQGAYFRATSLILSQKKSEGLKQLMDLTKLHPTFAKGFIGLADYYEREENYRKCLEHAEKATVLDSKDPAGFYYRAMAHLGMEDNQKALDDLGRSLARGPILESFISPTYPYCYRSYIYADLLGRPADGLRDTLFGVSLNPNSSNCKIGLWDYYFKTGKYHIAKLISEQMTQQEPKHDGALRSKALSLISHGILDDALRAAEDAVAVGSEDPKSHCYLTRGQVYFARGQFEDAAKDYDKAGSIQKDHFRIMGAKAYMLAACQEEKFRDGKTALQLATRCGKKTSMENARFLMLLAMAHAECGDFEQAVGFAKKSLEKAHPEFPWLDEYKKRLKLFEEKKPYRFDPASKVFDYIY
jgi:tetratricopeptide (TPR) repeat protein